MRLLFVSHSAELMGAERSLIGVVREACVRGHDVTVTLPKDGPLRARLEAEGAHVEVVWTRIWMGRRFNPLVGGVRLAQALASVPLYRRLIRKVKPDLVVTNSVVVPAGAIAAKTLGIKHVWIVRESLLTNPTLRSALPRRTVARLVGHLSAGVVAISDYVAGQLRQAAPDGAQRLRIIHPGVSRPAGGLGARLSAYPSEGLRKLVLLGPFMPEKGQEDALAALAACVREGAKLTLRLVGVGDREPEVAEQAARLGLSDLVETVAWSDDPWEHYAWADATLMLSRNEAFGRVTAESLLSGTPVIGYRAGATPEILAAGGGRLVEPDHLALAGLIMRLASDIAVFDRLCREAADRRDALASAEPSTVTLVSYLEAGP